MNSFEVELIRNNTTYNATAKIEGGMITVSAFNLGTKSASVSSNNDFLAELLLGELVNDLERRKK